MWDVARVAVMADFPQLPECGIGNFNPMEREREREIVIKITYSFFLGTKCGTKGTDIRLIRGKTWV